MATLNTRFPGLPDPPQKWDAGWGVLAQVAINNMLTGKLNCGNEVTLTAGGTTTVVTDTRVGGSSAPLPVAMTANAAAELGAGTMYISAVGKQTFTITHANNGQTDRTFRFAIIG